MTGLTRRACIIVQIFAKMIDVILVQLRKGSGIKTLHIHTILQRRRAKHRCVFLIFPRQAIRTLGDSCGLDLFLFHQTMGVECQDELHQDGIKEDVKTAPIGRFIIHTWRKSPQVSSAVSCLPSSALIVVAEPSIFTAIARKKCLKRVACNMEEAFYNKAVVCSWAHSPSIIMTTCLAITKWQGRNTEVTKQERFESLWPYST
jgi:hypothetical protein